MTSTRPLLTSKDVNAPVATVRPSAISKLPMPSKLRQPQAKRPLLSDEVDVDNFGPPRPKRRRSDTTTRPAPVNNAPARPQRPVSMRSRVTNVQAAAPKVSRPAGVAKTKTTARPTKPTTAYKTQAQPSMRPTTTSASAKPSTSTGTATGGPKKKRPAWDLKGRLEDIENQLQSRNVANNQLLLEIGTKSGDNQKLDESNQQLRSSLDRRVSELEDANNRIVQQEKRIRVAEDDLETSKRRFQQERDDLAYIQTKLERQVADLKGDLEASRQEVNGLKASIAQLTSAQAGMTAELAGTKLSLEQSREAGRKLQEENSHIKTLVAQREATIAEQLTKIRDNETKRRKLHNTIQELKGNIRVFCRVRPLLEDESTNGNLQHISFTGADEKSIEIVDAGLNESVGTRSNSNKKFEFNFDRVFSPASSQEDVFQEISQLVQSALDGYNVCVFAYGQTGSGKTFTMEGPTNTQDTTEGMIPRAVRQIFEAASELKEKGWEYSMEAIFLEIYNEAVRDLLSDVTSAAAAKKCEIKMVDSKGSDVEVTNSTTIEVTSQSQVHMLLNKASHNRAVAATNCNERSSRSHSVFRLKLSGTNNLTGEVCHGTLNLVDLAGSERLSQSGSTGDRLRETKNINRSLSNLGNVIMALANKDSHIPYRNSKLTHLLQTSLGGNSKTLMFVNISPCEDNIQESLCSLRFATKVNQCNIGTAQKKVK